MTNTKQTLALMLFLIPVVCFAGKQGTEKWVTPGDSFAILKHERFEVEIKVIGGDDISLICLIVHHERFSRNDKELARWTNLAIKRKSPLYLAREERHRKRYGSSAK
jgi:hypothetical protein